ncbi:MAG: cyclic pyranopterin monophosphate synthase MoaC [Firmicutes bacterium]|nr:cyclic pyranopterin monophosphate synthase MoaC [Bacillota bacterium]
MDFTHIDEKGMPVMVNVGDKPETLRTATAAGRVFVNEETFELIRSGGTKKGDVLSVAKLAGIMGAKKTSELIPLCHPIFVDGIDLDLRLNEEDLCVEIEATVSITAKTGVEMEAMTAVSVAALTVYDMCKAVQRDVRISDIHLVKKTGGVHGDYIGE